MHLLILMFYIVGKPKMMYIVKKNCSHCGSNVVDPKVEDKYYLRIEKVLSSVICFAG